MVRNVFLFYNEMHFLEQSVITEEVEDHHDKRLIKAKSFEEDDDKEYDAMFMNNEEVNEDNEDEEEEDEDITGSTDSLTKTLKGSIKKKIKNVSTKTQKVRIFILTLSTRSDEKL